jgi:predicted amidophosphoribosyltransferase
MTASSLVQGLLRLVAPETCPGCGFELDESPAMCRPAPSELSITVSCDDTAENGRSSFCDACKPLLEPAPAWLRAPARNASGFLYVGPLADAIRRFKYGGSGEYARPLGALLAEVASAYRGRVDAVVPLPLHRAKLRVRGYNPAALLAWPVAGALGVPLRAGWLERARPTRSQAGLSREARLENVRGAFVPGSAAPVRVLLIDDVRTTGATASAAASALEERGHSVSSLSLAWAPD